MKRLHNQQSLCLPAKSLWKKDSAVSYQENRLFSIWMFRKDMFMLNYAKIMLFCQHLAFHKYVDYKDSYEVLIATLIGFLRTDRMNEKKK